MDPFAYGRPCAATNTVGETTQRSRFDSRVRQLITKPQSFLITKPVFALAPRVINTLTCAISLSGDCGRVGEFRSEVGDAAVLEA
jgi:hypothetical protein